MSISVIIVLTSLVCIARALIVATNDENYRIEDESQPTYAGVDGQDTFVDSSHQEYVQKTNENGAVKIDRDDLTLSAGKTATFSLPTTTYHGGSSFGGSNFGHQSTFQTGFGHNSGGSSSFGGYGGGGGGHGGGDSGFGSLAPVIHKSVYVHVAPPEEDAPQQRVIVPRVPPRKNYQIVFIKAPTPPPPVAPVIPPFPPQSDKTLIYVLHPKPEEAPPIHIPPPPQNNPAKPEVYFIRYKTNRDNGPSGGGGGGYYRRYGRGDEEPEQESLEASDTTSSKSLPEKSDVPPEQYDEQNDSSGESSNVICVYTTERGINAH